MSFHRHGRASPHHAGRFGPFNFLVSAFIFYAPSLVTLTQVVPGLFSHLPSWECPIEPPGAASLFENYSYCSKLAVCVLC